jgi:hypothetical protein
MGQTNVFAGTCIPVPGQVVVAVAESFVSEVSLDGNKMAQLAGFVSTKSDFRGIATFRTLSVSGSSSQRVYFSFYAGGQSWSTWDGSPCSPGSSLRCTSYVQLSGGPSIHSMKILGITSFLLSVPEGTSFPSVTVQAISASNTSIQNMVMYAQFSRIAGASCPKYTTPLRFGKKLLQGFAITNEMGQARFNLSSSISGFAGAYDVTFVPSITSSFPRTLKFPVISVLIATSVASVSASGPDYVVRTLLRSRDASQGAPLFGRPAPTTFEEMKSSNYATFFRLYFAEESAGVSQRVARYLVSARDAGLNNVPEKLVELVSDPSNALDLFADTDCDGSSSGSSLRPNFLPVTLVDTGSVRLCLKMANPLPLAGWIRPPQVLHGINTARFYFVVDGVRSSFFVTVFLTPPFPSAPLTARLLLDNLNLFAKLMGLDSSMGLQNDKEVYVYLLRYYSCPILPPNSLQSFPFTPSSCAPSNQVPWTSNSGHNGGQHIPMYACIRKCIPFIDFMKAIMIAHPPFMPMFFFVLPPTSADSLSRVVGKAAVGATPFSVQYGLTNFDGLPPAMSRLCESIGFLRASFFPNSQALNALSSANELSLTTLSNNVYKTAASFSGFAPNVTTCASAYLKFVFNVSHQDAIETLKMSFNPAPPSLTQGRLFRESLFRILFFALAKTLNPNVFADLLFSSGVSGSVFVDVGFEVRQILSFWHATRTNFPLIYKNRSKWQDLHTSVFPKTGCFKDHHPEICSRSIVMVCLCSLNGAKEL